MKGNQSSSALFHLFVLVVGTWIIAGQTPALGQETTLLNFTCGSDGCDGAPYSGVITDGTNLYGTNISNTVFQLSPRGDGQWAETKLYVFTGGSDGGIPYGGLVRDAQGNFYGTTAYDGAGFGTVFELSPPPQAGGLWTETTLYQFKGGNDGANSQATLILDQTGNLYGTTEDGGYSSGQCCGTAFELSPPSSPGGAWSETVLHEFVGGMDGRLPETGLFRNEHGELFGTTYLGGANNAGTVFELTPLPGGSWSETVLYSFTGDADGGHPTAGVVAYKDALYGTTLLGGIAHYGTVFQLASVNGVIKETVLYSFLGGSDGYWPASTLTVDAGNLYGTTWYGGDLNNCQHAVGCGSIFELSPSESNGPWNKTTLFEFDGVSGAVPQGQLLVRNNALWGTTERGGLTPHPCTEGCGVVFRLGLGSGS